jgi:hypothetical protein
MIPRPLIFATPFGHGVLIRSRLPREEEVMLVLRPGESHCGRSFEEWLAVARGTGLVKAEWAEAA